MDYYNYGIPTMEGLYLANHFKNVASDKFPFIVYENDLFNLYVKTFNLPTLTNGETVGYNNNILLDAVKYYDSMLVALTSDKGLNLAKIYTEKIKRSCLFQRYIMVKYLVWNLPNEGYTS
jgi:hypothetical protein